MIDLYYLDVDLRSILMRYTNRIEINFRTKLIYEASNKYRNIPTWFAKHNLVMNSFITKLENVYYTDDFKSKNFPIYKHHSKVYK